jgi:predicted transcriptional regulator
MSATLLPIGVKVNLPADTIADLMTVGAVSIRDDATVADAIAFLIGRGISGVAVIDSAGRAIGVLSDSDLIIHARERLARSASDDDDRTFVRDIMTPAVFTLGPSAPAVAAIEHMRALNVHRLFVVDSAGVLIGVVTALDVLRRLELPE